MKSAGTVVLILALSSTTVFAERLAQPFREFCSSVNESAEAYRCRWHTDAPTFETCRPADFPNLEPTLPMLVCYRAKDKGAVEDVGEPEGVFRSYGTGWFFGRETIYTYVVHRSGALSHLRSRDDFRSVFAPVENKDQAIAYAQALGLGRVVTNVWKLRFMRGGSYHVWRWEIRPTRAQRQEDGFLVNLYHLHINGVSEMRALIHFDGTVSIPPKRPIWTRDDPVFDV